MKRPNDFLQESFRLVYDHASATADTTVKLFKADKPMVIDGVDYINPTGLVAHASDYFNLKVKKNAAVAANWSTLTGQAGTIAADTFVSLVNGTLADRSLAVGDILAVELDETGTATLPAGRFVIRGRYI